MSDRFRMRLAAIEDLNEAASLIEERSLWIAERGLDQWSLPIVDPRERMAERIREGKVWLLESPAGQLAGTITLGDSGEPFWKDATPALYLSRMATTRKYAGRNLGGAMLNWANNYALGKVGKLRLDAWKTNADLHQYYLNQGFFYMGTVHIPGRRSGALFERPVAEQIEIPYLT